MKVLIIGASTNPMRYSFMAVSNLFQYNHEVIPIGVCKGEIDGVKIINDKPKIKDVDTVTLYINRKIQKEYYDYILNEICPKRLIFNPGTENDEFAEKAEEKGILTVHACTLVMLSTNQF